MSFGEGFEEVPLEWPLKDGWGLNGVWNGGDLEEDRLMEVKSQVWFRLLFVAALRCT